MQVRGALDFPPTNGKSGCLFKLCIIPLTYRADCSMLMPLFQSMRKDEFTKPRQLL